MNIYNLSFDKEIPEKFGWDFGYNNQTEKQAVYPVFTSKMGDTELYVSCTKKLLEAKKIDEAAFSNENVAIIPLYGKALLDVKPEGKEYLGCYAICVQAEEGKKINNVNLINCAAINSRFTVDKKFISFIVFATKETFSITIGQNDGKLMKIDETGKVLLTLEEKTVKQYDRIIVKKLVILPKKSYITRFVRETKATSPIDGYVPVSIAQILSNNSFVISSSSQRVTEYDSVITSTDHQDIEKLKIHPMTILYKKTI